MLSFFPRRCEGLSVSKFVQIFFLCFLGVCLTADSAAQEGSNKTRIRTITVEVRDIFDESNLGFFYRTVNSLKVSSKEEVVRRELLVKEGDVF